MIWLIRISVILLIVGCSASKQRKKFIDKGLKNGWLDTTTRVNEFEIDQDSAGTDSCLDEIVNSIDSTDKANGGSGLKPEAKSIVKKALKKAIDNKYLPAVFPEKVLEFEDGSKAKIKIENGKIKGRLEHKAAVVKPPPWYQEYKMPVSIIGFCFLLLLLLFIILAINRSLSAK